MTEKIILPILAVCLLLSAQLTLAKPIDQHEDHFKDFDLCKLKTVYATLASNEKDHALEPSVQLMKVIVFDLQDLSLAYVRRAKNISDHIIKESFLSSNQSPEVKKFKQEIEEFEKKYNECANMDELFDLAELYANATAKYYEMETKDTLNADSKIIFNVLQKYTPKDMDEEFEQKLLNSFAVNFSNKIDELKEKLRDEEGGMGEKILQWWENVKSFNTIEEKMEAFVEFMKLYGFKE